MFTSAIFVRVYFIQKAAAAMATQRCKTVSFSRYHISVLKGKCSTLTKKKTTQAFCRDISTIESFNLDFVVITQWHCTADTKASRSPVHNSFCNWRYMKRKKFTCLTLHSWEGICLHRIHIETYTFSKIHIILDRFKIKIELSKSTAGKEYNNWVTFSCLV